MSGNESPGGDDSSSLSLSLTSNATTTKSSASTSRDSGSIHHLDPKYKNYVSAVDKALKSFEYSSEWHDLISALTKLNKVITSWTAKYGGDLPRLHLVTKRLSQCLHPNLPGGVHLKTLETYELIFKSIPTERIRDVIGPDLFSFASGLFPLWTYASEQTRPTLLRIYENYLLPLITQPALEGFLISILSGLSPEDNPAAATPTVVKEDPLSTIGRVTTLLGNVADNVGAQCFNIVLWKILKSNAKIRLAGISYVIRKTAITEDESLALDTLTSCLVTSDATNESVLVQRATLDLLLNHFQLSVLTEDKKAKLIKASLQTLLRRDMSLNRRLFSWILGSDPSNSEYFETHCKSPLIRSCKELLSENNLSSSELVRVLISLLDKPEIDILDDILLQIVIYFKRVDSKQCANLFFVNLKPDYVFDQIVVAIEANVDYCSLLEYIIDLDLPCFEYEKLLPRVFNSLMEIATPSNISEIKPIVMLILKKIELEEPLFESFIHFYLSFVRFDENDFNFNQFVKPRIIENFWTDFKICRPNQEDNIFGKVAEWNVTIDNLSVANSIFEELLDPRILKEVHEIDKWIQALIVIACHGDVETISLLVKVLKLLDKPVCYEILEQTYFVDLASRFLWEQEQFETLSELICLNKLRVERIILGFLKDYNSFRKLIDFLEFVGDFGDVKLLVYKLVENLDCSFEQYPSEFLELREQAEEFCCKMLRENDLRFIDVFMSNLLIDIETVGEHLSRSRREKENSGEVSNNCLNLGDRDGYLGNELSEKISIGASISDLTSEGECSYKSMEDENEEICSPLKSNSTPDLTNLAANGQTVIQEKLQAQQLSRSMGDLRKIEDEVDVNIPEIVIQDQESPSAETKGKGPFSGDANDCISVTTNSVTISQAIKLASPFILTPSTELATEAKAKPTPRRFSKKLGHPHLKVSKDISEDVQNRVLYALGKVEKLLLLRPELFVSYLKACSTSQSAHINYREECVYLELLIGKLLDFMCLVIPTDDTTLQLGNLNVQFKACNVLKLLLEKVLECERVEGMIPHTAVNTGINNTATGNDGKGRSSFNGTPTSSNTVLRRQNFQRHKRKSSASGCSSHFVSDILTRVKVQKTLLFVLRSTTSSLKAEEFDESASNSLNQGEGSDNNGPDLSVELMRQNYGRKYLSVYQGLLLNLSRTIISLEYLISSVHQHHYNPSKSLSVHRNHPNSHKYMAFLPLTNQPLFHEILLTALELNDGSNNAQHFNWMDLNMHVLPYIINTNCPMIVLTVTQVCKNLQVLGRNPQVHNESYILRSLDFLITITNAVLFRHGDKSDKPEESNQNQPSSSIYGIITSFLPGGSSTSPKMECVDEIDAQSKDILTKLDTLLKTALTVRSSLTKIKLRNLLNPICNSYLDHFLSSLSVLKPGPELTELCRDIETIRVEKLTLIATRNLNRNLLSFYRDFMRHVETIEFSSGLLNSLVKESLAKNVGLVTICEIVNDLYSKFKADSWSKQELKELQENLFKIFDRLVAEVCNQNSSLLLDSNSVESNSSSNGQIGFLSSQGLQGKSYNFKKVSAPEENMEEILASLCINLPSLMDMLWTDDKDRDKVMPLLGHLLSNLIGLIKLRHTSTVSYVSILKLLKNISYYSYFRKSWKKDVFDMLLLDPSFFLMIKPHYYYSPLVPERDERDSKIGASENQFVVQIWKVIMDNLFTQDKSSFSELLTRVSVPQTSGLSIFTSKDTEFEGRALLLKRLAFVIWSSEQDQFSKFMTNIQERLSEALKTPNSPQMVPIVLRSVFICFRVLILKFSNLSALWPIIIHEVVQILLQLEKQLANGTKLDPDQLACALEVFKLIELLDNLPSDTLPLFQMYRWAFVPNCSTSTEENLLENNNITNGFVPFLSRISLLVEDPFLLHSSGISCSNGPSLDKEKRINPSKIRVLTSLSDVYDFLNGNCDTISLQELCEELDLDFIEC